MIIACPACATRYVVPDSAIGLEGRTVRCAKCKHSWFQDGPELAEPIAAAYAAPARAETTVTPPPPRPAPPPVQSRRGPIAQEPTPFDRAELDSRPVEEKGEASGRQPVPPWADENEDEDAEGEQPVGESVAQPPSFDAAPVAAEWDAEPAPADPDFDDVSQFDHSPPFRPRRNWLRWLTWGAGAFAALALAAVAAMSVYGTPSWLPIEKPLFGADPGLQVEFPASEQERRTLPNGAEFFGARVVVRNDGRETKRVPPLLIVLRDSRERVVYSWELAPPQRTLAPGEAMTINEAMTDVPKSAVYADIGWAPR